MTSWIGIWMRQLYQNVYQKLYQKVYQKLYQNVYQKIYQNVYQKLYQNKIRAHRLFISSLLVCGAASISFGFLQWVNDRKSFLAL